MMKKFYLSQRGGNMPRKHDVVSFDVKDLIGVFEMKVKDMTTRFP